MVHDNINPKHYAGSCSIQCIDMMRMILGEKAVIGFCLGNAFKYIWRHKAKNGLEDLQKADWYLLYMQQEMDLSAEDEDKLDKLINLLDDAMEAYKNEDS